MCVRVQELTYLQVNQQLSSRRPNIHVASLLNTKHSYSDEQAPVVDTTQFTTRWHVHIYMYLLPTWQLGSVCR